LPADQVIAGLSFLREIEGGFYRMHDFPRSAVAGHRKRLNSVSGKHAVALAVRAPWDLKSRFHIFILGLRCLQSAGWATLLGLASRH